MLLLLQRRIKAEILPEFEPNTTGTWIQCNRNSPQTQLAFSTNATTF
ncbi:MAG: hypothetical protein LUH22_14120 [Bacteroides sp.]|nr:hypothetical protein [Bacteroides sp.]